MSAQLVHSAEVQKGLASRVLVTGASGFIGRLLCQELVLRRHHVVAMLRSSVPGPWHETVQAELGHTGLDPSFLVGVDTIFHLAGKAHVRARSAAEIAQYEAVHVHGTRALLQAARSAGVRCLVLVSSVKAMGEGAADLWDEATPCAPQTVYGRTKLAAERLVLDSGVPCPVVLRPALVYGAGVKGNLAALIRAVRTGAFPRIVFPANARSMIHVQDVVQACLLAATNPASCRGIYILTDGHAYSTNELLRWIHDALGVGPRFPLPYAWLVRLARLGDVCAGLGLPAPVTSQTLAVLAGSALYSNQRICRELGFRPQWTLREGIAEMVAAS